MLGWVRTREYDPVKKDLQTKVSVIVPVRNEGKNILKCLADILKQDISPNLFEVLVIDDHSEDNTVQVIEHLLKTDTSFPQVLKLLKPDGIKTSYKGKKAAIQQAVEHASGQLIVTTDADCRMNPMWLSTIVNYYETYSPKMISGPVSFRKERTLFGKLQTLEFLSLIGSGAAAIGNKIPLMCNGANLAYERAAFFQAGGYNTPGQLASGDDVTLMLSMHKQYPGEIHFLKAWNAVVYTDAVPNLREFFVQRVRWASKTFKVSNWAVSGVAITVFIANLITLAGILTFPFLSSAICCNIFMRVLTYFVIIKVSLDSIFLSFMLFFFKRKDLLLLILPAQFIYSFYIVLVGTVSTFSRTYRWKGRIVR